MDSRGEFKVVVQIGIWQRRHTVVVINHDNVRSKQWVILNDDFWGTLQSEISSHMYSFSNANFRLTIEGLTVRSIPAIETTIITKDYGNQHSEYTEIVADPGFCRHASLCSAKGTSRIHTICSICLECGLVQKTWWLLCNPNFMSALDWWKQRNQKGRRSGSIYSRCLVWPNYRLWR